MQLIEQMKLRIVSGRYKAGDRLPGVRELAAEASVNPNTMQRALGELESCGLINTMRTAGRYVTEDSSAIEKARAELVAAFASEFLHRMKLYGFTKEEIINILKETDGNV